jgi:hypothetical protein
LSITGFPGDGAPVTMVTHLLSVPLKVSPHRQPVCALIKVFPHREPVFVTLKGPIFKAACVCTMYSLPQRQLVSCHSQWNRTSVPLIILLLCVSPCISHSSLSFPCCHQTKVSILYGIYI